MAPRFRQHIFQTYRDDDGASAFIGFPIHLLTRMEAFRDTLRDEISQVSGLLFRANIEGPWDDIDIHFRFFDEEDGNTFNAFYSKPGPSCLSWLFRTLGYRNYLAESDRLNPLIKTEITTSHDYPCIVVENSILGDETLARIIQKVSNDLDMKIVRSHFPRSMNEILMSNREFNIEEGA